MYGTRKSLRRPCIVTPSDGGDSSFSSFPYAALDHTSYYIIGHAHGDTKTRTNVLENSIAVGESRQENLACPLIVKVSRQRGLFDRISSRIYN